MAAIDYGTLIIKDGKVLNNEYDLFPDLVLGEYTVQCYKKTVTIFKTDNKENKEVYWLDGDRYSYYLDTVLGKIVEAYSYDVNNQEYIYRSGFYNKLEAE